jgi:hypothetical protein
MEFWMAVIGQPNDCSHHNNHLNGNNKTNGGVYAHFLPSSAPDWMRWHRNRMNRTNAPFQDSDGIMGGLAAIASVPIGAKQEIKYVL